MALSAPSIILIKSEFNSNYLRFQEDRKADTQALLRFNETNIHDPYVQFEVVKAKKGDDLFHLKCRFNNKFLVRWVPDMNWIAAAADSPNEDESSWSCTLFKPVLVSEDPNGKSKRIRIFHVQLEYPLINWSDPAMLNLGLSVGSSVENAPDKRDIFSVVEWKAFFGALPKRVAIKANYNGKYLGVVMLAGNRPHLQFTFNDPKDPKVENEILQHKNGLVCIRNTYIGKFWLIYLGDTYTRIFVEENDDPRLTNNLEALFRPHVLDINSVALLNMKNYKYCISQNIPNLGVTLRVTSPGVDPNSKFQLIDLDQLP